MSLLILSSTANVTTLSSAIRTITLQTLLFAAQITPEAIIGDQDAAVVQDISTVAGPSFSPEQQQRFQTRYEEGFDIPGDLDYVCWLQLNHPDSPLVHGQVEAEEPDTIVVSDTSLAQHFSGVAPLTAVSVDTHTLGTSPPPTLAPSTPSSTIAKYLTTPQVATPSGRKGEPPRARLLTSAAAIEMLNEKERKKQEEIEMKERERKEREEMKKKREDEQRKKSQERVRKAEQRAKQKAEKEAQKVQRTQKAKAKVSQTTNAGAKGSDCTRTTRKAKCARTDTNCEADFNDSECCVCFVPYEEDQSGKDWVACGCGRWLHEDCADDCIIDSDGNERLCLICLNRYGK